MTLHRRLRRHRPRPAACCPQSGTSAVQLQWHRDFEHQPTHAEQQQIRMAETMSRRERDGRTRHDHTAMRAARTWARREHRRAAAAGSDLTEWRRGVEHELEHHASPQARANAATPVDALHQVLDTAQALIAAHAAHPPADDTEHGPPPRTESTDVVRTLIAAPCAPNQ